MMNVRRGGNIRIIVRHPKLVRVGTNLLLVSLFAAAFYAVDPGNSSWGFERSQAVSAKLVRYAPIIVAAASAFCYLVGVRGIPVGWPVMFLAVFSAACVSGGGVTLFVRHVPFMETFTGRGLCAIPFIPAYVMCLLPAEKRYFAKGAAGICLTAAVVAYPVLVAWRLGYRIVHLRHIYHITAIYFCAAAGFGIADRRAVIRRMATLSFALECVLTIKLTGFGFAAIIAAILWRVETSRHARESRTRLMNRRLWVSQLAVGTLVAAVLLATAYQRYLPGGSREVRLQTYSVRLAEFANSPIWGSLFFGSPTMYAGALYVPSHSDILDLLAFGGLIGTALFLVPAAAGVVHGVRRLKLSVLPEDRLSTFGLITALCFIYQCAVNPVEFDPRFGPVYWIALGVLLADRAVAGRVHLAGVRAERMSRPVLVRPAAVFHPASFGNR